MRPVVALYGWKVDISAYIQADSVAYSQESIDQVDPSTGKPLNEERFVVRRARLRTDGVRGPFFGTMELDGNTVDGAAARLQIAYVGWRYVPAGAQAPLVAITAGLFPIPFGAEVPSNPRFRAFLELPAFARALFPGDDDAGVMAQGAYGLVRWSVAAMNGAPVGDAQWKGVDPVSSYDLIARLGMAVDLPRKWHVEAGVSALTGDGLDPGTPPTKDDIQWVDENGNGIVEASELHVIAGQAATPATSYRHDAVGADARVTWCLCGLGNGTAFAELAVGTNLDRALIYADPVLQNRDLRELGFVVGAVQEVGDHLLAGVRYDRYNGDRDLFETQGVTTVAVPQVFSTTSVMAAARWHDGRLMVQYDHERNPFGRADDGQPATRRADRLTLRAQVGF